MRKDHKVISAVRGPDQQSWFKFVVCCPLEDEAPLGEQYFGSNICFRHFALHRRVERTLEKLSVFIRKQTWIRELSNTSLVRWLTLNLLLKVASEINSHTRGPMKGEGVSEKMLFGQNNLYVLIFGNTCLIFPAKCSVPSLHT